MGLIPVRDSDFFSLSHTHVSLSHTHVMLLNSHLITKLKIHHFIQLSSSRFVTQHNIQLPRFSMRAPHRKNSMHFCLSSLKVLYMSINPRQQLSGLSSLSSSTCKMYFIYQRLQIRIFVKLPFPLVQAKVYQSKYCYSSKTSNENSRTAIKSR